MSELITGIVIGVEITSFVAIVIWMTIKRKKEDKTEFFHPREEIAKLSAQIVSSHEWRPMTVSKAITNVNFDVDGEEYRAVLNLETMEHFKERTSDEED